MKFYCWWGFNRCQARWIDATSNQQYILLANWYTLSSIEHLFFENSIKFRKIKDRQGIWRKCDTTSSSFHKVVLLTILSFHDSKSGRLWLKWSAPCHTNDSDNRRGRGLDKCKLKMTRGMDSETSKSKIKPYNTRQDRLIRTLLALWFLIWKSTYFFIRSLES